MMKKKIAHLLHEIVSVRAHVRQHCYASNQLAQMASASMAFRAVEKILAS